MSGPHIKPPAPTTREVWLVPSSAPKHRPHATRHRYVGTVISLTVDAAWEHMFECVETGSRRAWGCDGAPDKDLDDDDEGN